MKKLKGKLRVRTVSRSEGREKVLADGTTQIEYPHDGTHSRVGVALGQTRTNTNYCSVRIDVDVQVPCNPGEEDEALAFCAEKASDKVMELAPKLDSYLESL